MKSSSALILCLILAAVASACGGGDSPTSASATVNVPFSTTDLRVGTGADATSGRTATVNYALWLYSATAVDNKGTAVEAGPFSFVVNGGGVIPGFNQTVVGMKVGGMRRAIIPPNLAYGSGGSPPKIPGNATLVFEVELVSVQ